MTTLLSAVEAALAEVPARRHIQSIIVARGGDVLLERYFRDRRASDLSNIHSVTKSVLATLVGIALRDGFLELGTKVGEVSRPVCWKTIRARAPSRSSTC